MAPNPPAFLLRLVHRRRRRPRPHRRNIRIFQHPQHFSQADHRGAWRHSRHIFADSHFRDRRRRCSIIPLLGPWIDRYGGRGDSCPRRSHGRRGLAAFQLGAKFLAVCLVRCSLVIAGEALLGLLGDQRHDRAVVRAQTRPSHGRRELGHRRRKTRIPLLAAYPVRPHRLARHLGGVRNHRAGSGRRTRTSLCAKKARRLRAPA